MSRGDPTIFFTRPISLVLLLLAVASLVVSWRFARQSELAVVRQDICDRRGWCQCSFGKARYASTSASASSISSASRGKRGRQESATCRHRSRALSARSDQTTVRVVAATSANVPPRDKPTAAHSWAQMPRRCKGIANEACATPLQIIPCSFGRRDSLQALVRIVGDRPYHLEPLATNHCSNCNQNTPSSLGPYVQPRQLSFISTCLSARTPSRRKSTSSRIWALCKSAPSAIPRSLPSRDPPLDDLFNLDQNRTVAVSSSPCTILHTPWDSTVQWLPPTAKPLIGHLAITIMVAAFCGRAAGRPRPRDE